MSSAVTPSPANHQGRLGKQYLLHSLVASCSIGSATHNGGTQLQAAKVVARGSGAFCLACMSQLFSSPPALSLSSLSESIESLSIHGSLAR